MTGGGKEGAPPPSRMIPKYQSLGNTGEPCGTETQSTEMCSFGLQGSDLRYRAPVLCFTGLLLLSVSATCFVNGKTVPSLLCVSLMATPLNPPPCAPVTAYSSYCSLEDTQREPRTMESLGGLEL